MEDIKYKQLLLQIEDIELVYVDRQYLEKNAVFSVYNLHIKKKNALIIYINEIFSDCSYNFIL